MRDFNETVRAALKALNTIKAEYVIIGGLASIYYGRPRTTTDIDIVIDYKKTGYGKVVDSLKQHGFDVGTVEAERVIDERTHLTAFDTMSPYRLDLKGIHDPLDEASLKRRREETLFGERTWIESPEDLIVAKLVYGSQQDMEDALSILIRQKSSLNMDYLRIQATRSRVNNKLSKLLRSI